MQWAVVVVIWVSVVLVMCHVLRYDSICFSFYVFVMICVDLFYWLCTFCVFYVQVLCLTFVWLIPKSCFEELCLLYWGVCLLWKSNDIFWIGLFWFTCSHVGIIIVSSLLEVCCFGKFYSFRMELLPCFVTENCVGFRVYPSVLLL